jgi:hypothetical protein
VGVLPPGGAAGLHAAPHHRPVRPLVGWLVTLWVAVRVLFGRARRH